MADEVIRRDVVELEFEVNNDPLEKVNKELDKIKSVLEKSFGKKVFDDFEDGAEDASDSVDKIGDSLKKIKTDPLKKAKEVLEDVDDNAKKSSKSLKDMADTNFSKLKSGLSKVSSSLGTLAKKAAKVTAVGVGAAAVGIGAIVKQSTEAYAAFEQNIGGVETLFKDSAGLVQKHANDAYKTAGLSANQYMETATSFSASLLQSLGGDTEAAANLSNKAIIDMSDNANKMGTSMESIIQTYQSLSRGNFAMLDNLKLGYGGTKEEMKRLIKDASKLDKSVKANDMSFGNMVKAIHAVQEEMGITGTTAKEASTTITGSLAGLKSSWNNTLTALITGGDSFDQCLDNLVSSAKTFGKNIFPAIKKALSGVGKLIVEIAPEIEKAIPTLVKELLPPLIKGATSVVAGLIKALPSIIGALIKEIPNIITMLIDAILEAFGVQLPALNKIGSFFSNLANTFGDKLVPAILGAVVAFKAFKGVKFITSIFGKTSKVGGGGKGGGIFDGITNSLKNIGKAKTKNIAKGMLNLGIILGGMAVITAVCAGIFAITKKYSNFREMLEMVGIIGAVGAVGGALAKIAGIIGKIPVAVVAKGLAGIAIILGGMGAVIWAFGALSKIPGVKSFVDAGGKLLVSICQTLGEMVGSLIGGAMVGITNGLPAVGANITGFVKALQPMFSMIKGVDMKGLGDFLKSIGVFFLTMSAGELLSFLTGGIDFSGITDGLGQLANGKGIKNFFAMVSTITDDAFSRASAFFKCLGGVSALPKTGGIFQWFTGDIDYAGLKNGLGQLSDAKVINFFSVAGSISSEALTAATNLFKCLGGVDALPKSGGVFQWFTGDIDYAGLKNGLGHLSDKKVTNFFTTASAIGAEAMTAASNLFKCLSGVEALPSDGGVFSWFTGSIDYEGLKNGLGHLSADKVKKFFTWVATVTPETMSSASNLFKCLSGVENLPSDGGIFGWFTGSIDYEGLKNGLGQLSDEKVKKFFAFVGSLTSETMELAKSLFKCLAGVTALPSDGGIFSWFTGSIDYAGVKEGLGQLADDKVKKFFSWTATLTSEAMDSAGKLFTVLGGVNTLPKGGGLFSWFTGTIDYTGLKDGLGQLQDDKVRKFFEWAETIPSEAMDSAGKLFKVLGGVKTLPTDGGIGSWFTGTIDYEGLKNGLGQLKDDKVKKFFEFVNKIPKEAFEKAKSFFQSFSDIGSIPTKDGIDDWFNGTIDYEGLSNGLKELTNKDVKAFYEMAGSLDKKCYENVGALFQSLSDIGNIPTTDGFGDWFDGTIDYKGTAQGLSDFMTHGKGFITGVKSIQGLKFDRVEKMVWAVGEMEDIDDVDVSGIWAKAKSVSAFMQHIPNFITGVKSMQGVTFGVVEKMVWGVEQMEDVADVEVSGIWAKAKSVSAFMNDAKGYITGVKSLQGVTFGVVEKMVWAVGKMQALKDYDVKGIWGKAQSVSAFFDNADSFVSGVKSLQGVTFGVVGKMVWGVGQLTKLTGYDLTGIGGKADTLSDFMTRAKNFFTISAEVDTTAVDTVGNSISNFAQKIKDLKTNGFPELKGTASSVMSDLETIVDNGILAIVTSISEMPTKMGQGIEKSSGDLSDSFVTVWKNTVNAVKSPVNKLIGGANWILKEFGSEKVIADWKPYAKGTDGHRGGNALVNDGRGAELIQMPNGKTFIPQGKNVFIPNAPKGMKVLPAEQTAQMMGRKSPTYKYANGTGNIDIMGYFDNHEGLVNAVKKEFVDYNGLSGLAKDLGVGMVNTMSGAMTSWVKELYDEFGVGKNWLFPSVYRVITSLFGSRNAPTKGASKNHGGIDIGAPYGSSVFASKGGKVSRAGWAGGYGNLVEINHGQGWTTRYGHNSSLLVSEGQRVRQGQTVALVGSTGVSTGAHIHFEIRRNGVAMNPLQFLGYANGGIATRPSIFGEDGAEMAIPLSKNRRSRAVSLWKKTGRMLGYTPENSVSGGYSAGATENNSYAPVFNFYVNGSVDDRTTAHKLKNQVKEAMYEVFESMGRRDPSLQAT